MPADKPTVNVATASSTPGPSEPAVRNGCPGPVRLLGQGKFGFGAGPNVSFGADGGPARVQSQLSAQFSWAGNIFQQSWKNWGGPRRQRQLGLTTLNHHHARITTTAPVIPEAERKNP